MVLKHFITYYIISLSMLTACNAPQKTKTVTKVDKPIVLNMDSLIESKSKTDSYLAKIIEGKSPFLDSLLALKKTKNIQIIYGQIDRGANGNATVKNYHYGTNANKYFYPASTVKFPIVVLALQRLNELKEKGIDANTTMLTETGTPKQTPVYNDPTTIDGRPTIGHYIKKILLVSDNDAYNRLYEFLGQEYINRELKRRGYSAEITHRLSISLSSDENRKTNPIRFVNAQNETLYQQDLQSSNWKFQTRADSIGSGYMLGGKLMNKPMDFSTKNKLILEDLHQIVQSIIFPESVTGNKRFEINEVDRQMLLYYMSMLPTESKFPQYADDPNNYWTAYCKFLLFGSEKGALSPQIRIFNKVGDAYGHLIDAAYIVDFENNIEFFLSAVIYCNEDGILNDDKYDYDQYGFRFMKELGKIIYEYELKRGRKKTPDLSKFKFNYNL